MTSVPSERRASVPLMVFTDLSPEGLTLMYVFSLCALYGVQLSAAYARHGATSKVANEIAGFSNLRVFITSLLSPVRSAQML